MASGAGCDAAALGIAARFDVPCAGNELAEVGSGPANGLICLCSSCGVGAAGLCSDDVSV